MSKFPVEISTDYFIVSDVAFNNCTEVQSYLHGPHDVPNVFLDAFEKLRKLIIIIVVKSVCLSVLPSVSPRGTLEGLSWNSVLKYSVKICRKKSDKHRGLGKDTFKFIIIYRWQIRMSSSDKVVQETKTHILCSITSPPPQNTAVYEMMWKNMLETDTPYHKR
jgi:hypothetical protein